MKNWQIMGILIFLIIGTVLIAGCTSTESTRAAPVAVSTPTPQIVYVTVLVTPAPIVAWAQDPIIGVWRCSGYGYDFWQRFNADGTVQSFYTGPDMEDVLMDGTWNSIGKNSYIISFSANVNENWIYVPSSDGLYNTGSPAVIYTRYQGGVKTPTPTPSVAASQTKHYDLSGGCVALALRSNEKISDCQVYGFEDPKCDMDEIMALSQRMEELRCSSSLQYWI